MSTLRRACIGLAVAATGLLLAGCGSHPVARVNGKPISQEEFDKEVRLIAGPQVLDGIIGRKVVLHEAARKGISLDDAQVNAEVATLKKHYGNALKSPEFANVDVREQVEVRLLLPRLMISDEEVAKAVAEHPRAFEQKERATYYRMVLPSEEAATSARRDVIGKSDAYFARMADSRSMPNTNAGAPQVFIKGMASGAPDADAKRTFAAIEEHLFTLRPGGTSEPFVVTAGVPNASGKGRRAIPAWLVVRMLSHTPAKQLTLAKDKDQIREAIFAQKNATDEVTRYLLGLKAKARIEIDVPAFAVLQEQYRDAARTVPAPSPRAPVTVTPFRLPGTKAAGGR